MRRLSFVLAFAVVLISSMFIIPAQAQQDPEVQELMQNMGRYMAPDVSMGDTRQEVKKKLKGFALEGWSHPLVARDEPDYTGCINYCKKKTDKYEVICSIGFINERVAGMMVFISMPNRDYRSKNNLELGKLAYLKMRQILVNTVGEPAKSSEDGGYGSAPYDEWVTDDGYRVYLECASPFSATNILYGKYLFGC